MGQFFCAWAVSSAYIIVLCACALAIVAVTGCFFCRVPVQSVGVFSLFVDCFGIVGIYGRLVCCYFCISYCFGVFVSNRGPL